jgi:hypothetical protein
MMFVSVAAAVLASQMLVLSRAWLGTFGPDPLVLLAAYATLYAPRRSVLPSLVLLGWLRALVLLEPAGGQVLCLLVAGAIVSGLREHLVEHRQLGFVLGALILAGCWSMAAALVSAGFGVVVLGGRELVLGAALSVPLAALAGRANRRLGARA